MLKHTYHETPIGRLQILANNTGILKIAHQRQIGDQKSIGTFQADDPFLNQVKAQLSQYFEHKRQVFTLPLAYEGTQFQKQVWAYLLTINYGSIKSYQDIAKAIGNPKAVRAVGMACHKNPISIMVPCHRVNGKNGRLTGYAGGLEHKVALLKLEGYYLL